MAAPNDCHLRDYISIKSTPRTLILDGDDDVASEATRSL